MDLAETFVELASMMSGVAGGPYQAGVVITQDDAVFDEGGSIVTPGDPSRRSCMVQIDAATEAMRRAEGYAEGDVRFLIVSLAGGLDTDAVVEVPGGPSAGTWMISAIERDPAGIGYVGRGRRA